MEQHDPQDEYPGAPNPSPVIEAPSTGQSAEVGKNYKSEPRSPLWKRLTFWNIFFNGLLTVTTAGLGIIAYWQLEATDKAITISKVANKTSEEALRVSHENMIRSQQAYVNAHEIKVISFEVGKFPEARVSHRNSGLTPANHLSIAPDSFIFELSNPEDEFAPPPIKEDYLACGGPRGPGSILPPGVTRTINTRRVLAPMHNVGPLTKKNIEDIRHWRATWYVVVYISYIDSFGYCHRTVEPFEFDPFTNIFSPTTMNARMDRNDRKTRYIP